MGRRNGGSRRVRWGRAWDCRWKAGDGGEEVWVEGGPACDGV